MRRPFTLAMLLLQFLSLTSPASAFNYVVDANGTYWGIQDVDPPRVDTGSIAAPRLQQGGSVADAGGAGSRAGR